MAYTEEYARGFVWGKTHNRNKLVHRSDIEYLDKQDTKRRRDKAIARRNARWGL